MTQWLTSNIHNSSEHRVIVERPGRAAAYCDQFVCLSLCVCLSVREHMSGLPLGRFSRFFVQSSSGSTRCPADPRSVARSSSGGVAIPGRSMNALLMFGVCWFRFIDGGRDLGLLKTTLRCQNLLIIVDWISSVFSFLRQFYWYIYLFSILCMSVVCMSGDSCQRPREPCCPEQCRGYMWNKIISKLIQPSSRSV